MVQLMLVFVLAVLLGIAFRYLQMPAIVGHVLAGLVVGLIGLFGDTVIDSLRVMGTVGVTLLLFLVGLELNWSEVKRVASKVTSIFLWQTFFSIVMFTVFGLFVGLSLASSLFFSIAFSFCSTIVVVKVLSEKKDLASLPGKITLGILLFQDLLAILLMILISHYEQLSSVESFAEIIARLAVFCGLVYLGGRTVVSGFMKNIVKTGEDLVLLSISWLLFVVYVGVNWLEVVPEVAGFLAGVSLASYWGHAQIVTKVKTVRDFFLTLFFVYLGLQINFYQISWMMAITGFLLVVFGKFFIVFLTTKINQLNANTAFKISLSMTQLSEFSLVVLALGYAKGLWGIEMVSTVSVIGLASMVASTWLMSHSSIIYGVAKKKLPRLFMSRPEYAYGLSKELPKGHIVLVGADRTGRSLLNYLKKDVEQLMVVDFNPVIVEKLNRMGIRAIFGDATDPEVVNLANMRESKLIISTIKDYNDTQFFLRLIKSTGIKAPILVDAESNEQAKELYKLGADYVIFPHFVSGHHLNQVIRKYLKNKVSLKDYKERQAKAILSVYE